MISVLLAELLREFGHEVCGTATTETEAVAAAMSHAPDLMIVDVHLRAGSGIAAMETILLHCAVPHIFMTGGSRQCIPVTATVLYKPFGKTYLIAALGSVFRQFGPREWGSGRPG